MGVRNHVTSGVTLCIHPQSVSEVTRDEAGIETLCEYYNQLQLVGKRFLHPRIRHGIVFTW